MTTVMLNAVADNTLYESSTGDLSNGKGSHIFSGVTFQAQDMNLRRGLLRFDVATAVPIGAHIDAVTLRLNMSMTNAGAYDFALHKVLADWGEGASIAPGGEGGGAAATPDSATWLHRFYSQTFWASPGGDFASTASAVTSVAAEGIYYWTSSVMAADVQAWLDTPSTQFGWLLKAVDETASGNAKRFDSRENLTASNQPLLTIDYSMANQAPTLDPIADPAPILENAGAQTMNLAGISAGPGESQTLTVTAVSSNPGLIPNPIVTYTSPNATGSLSYTPVTNESGTATITVTVMDNGGTANGGVDTRTRTFTIRVMPTVTNINDGGAGSLRQAILDFNAHSGDPPTIVFAIGGPNPHTIQLLSQLPAIAHPVFMQVDAADLIEIGVASTFTLGDYPSLTKIGTGTLVIGGAQSHAAAATLNANAGSLSLASDGGANLTLNANATVNLTATQHLAALNIASGVVVTVASGGGKVLVTNNLAIAETGQLDLADNDLVLHAAPGTKAVVLADLASKITSGYGANSPHWQGAGITSSAAAADASHLTALGVLLNANALDQALYTNFSGETVNNNSVLVKFTYVGDANLSGAVDGSDYAMIDNGFNFGLTGWSNGDFNYSTTIDGTDYAILDNAYNSQAGPLALRAAPLGVLIGLNQGGPDIRSHTAPASFPFSGPTSMSRPFGTSAVVAAIPSDATELRQSTIRDASRQIDDSPEVVIGEVDDDLLELLTVGSVANQ